MNAAGPWLWASPACGLIVLAASAYAAGRRRLWQAGRRWPGARDLAFAMGIAGLLAALVSPIAAFDDDFRFHIAQHVLLGMVSPAAFALAAPVTLALRTAPHAVRRALVAVLHWRLVRAVSCAPCGAILATMPLYALYLTPLYELCRRNGLLHIAVHAHMFAAGCLIAWALIGTDAVPGRGSRSVRCAALAAIMAAHDVLAKLMYAHAPILAARNGVALADWRSGAQVLWYGGDAAGIALAILYFHQWYAAAGTRRRAAGANLAARTRAGYAGYDDKATLTVDA